MALFSLILHESLHAHHYVAQSKDAHLLLWTSSALMLVLLGKLKMPLNEFPKTVRYWRRVSSSNEGMGPPS